MQIKSKPCKNWLIGPLRHYEHAWIPKSLRSSPKDENWASYGLHKLGKFVKNA